MIVATTEIPANYANPNRPTVSTDKTPTIAKYPAQTIQKQESIETQANKTINQNEITGPNHGHAA